MAPVASLSDVLEHPLLLLLIGALVTGLLVPLIARRYQNRQQALQLKAGLLASLSDAVTRVVTHAWFRELGGKPELTKEDREEFDWRYGEWEIETRNVEKQLQAYFAGSPDLAGHWARYCELLRALHHLSWERNGRDVLIAELREPYENPALWRLTARRGQIRPSQREFSAPKPEDVRWREFLDTRNRHTYMGDDWGRLKAAMEAPLTPLCEAILYADVETM